jgi:hypothetical protein
MLGVVGAVTQAAAAPILYDINFTQTNVVSGDPLQTPGPPVGSFKYDSTAVSSPFSEFFVVWNSITFDFTAEANRLDSPGSSLIGPCNTAAANPIDRFNALTGGCGTNREWTGATAAGSLSTFELRIDSPAQVVIADVVTDEPRRFDVLASGVFDITASEVPEPSTYALLLSGGALMLATGRRIRRGQEKSNER